MGFKHTHLLRLVFGWMVWVLDFSLVGIGLIKFQQLSSFLSTFLAHILPYYIVWSDNYISVRKDALHQFWSKLIMCIMDFLPFKGDQAD